MKNYLLALLLLAFGFNISAQSTFVDFGIFETTPDNYSIRAQAEGTGLQGEPFNITSNFQITLRWQTSSPVIISGENSPAGVTISKTTVSHSLAGPTAGYSYVSFNYGPSNIPIPIMNGQAIDLITFVNSEGGSVIMELMENGEAPQDIPLNLGQTYTAVASPSDNYRLNYQPSSSPNLAVELSLFEATPYHETDALLEWTTSTENNSSHYELERSQNGRDWNQIKHIPAAGFSTSILKYTYMDEKVYLPGSGKKVIYYRLKLVDVDLSFQYSEIKSITFSGTGNDIEFSIYPNPTSYKIQVEQILNLGGDYENFKYQIIDVNGALILTDVLNGVSTQVSLERFATGSYFLNILDAQGKSIFKDKFVVFRD